MKRTWLVSIGLSVLLFVATTSLVSVAMWQAAERAIPFEVREDLTYGPNERNELDLFLPKDEGENLRPAVVIIHGGAWRSGNKKQLRLIAEMFAKRGYVAAAINYRLAPKYSYPAQLDDCQRVVRWLRKNAKDFRIDQKSFGAAGASAGGHLSLLLGTRETRDDSDPELKGISSKVQCVLSIFGPTDFTSERYVQASKIPFVGKALIEFVGKTYDEAPDLWKEVSPVHHVSPDDAPTFIIHGDQDFLVPLEQSERFVEALKKVGVEVKLVVIKGMGHGPTTPEQREEFVKAINEAIDFFDKHLKR
ncbi:MAG: alpha/beta hydrolase [Armatimonadetes bacterium]|nr:alpha/beta hydrolase [Armatimonadota bacterium]